MCRLPTVRLLLRFLIAMIFSVEVLMSAGRISGIQLLLQPYMCGVR